MAQERFDVCSDGNNYWIEHHFCRNWSMDEAGNEIGCYGTNPDHGYTFEEAVREIIERYRQQIEYWSGLTIEEWRSKP